MCIETGEARLVKKIRDRDEPVDGAFRIAFGCRQTIRDSCIG